MQPIASRAPLRGVHRLNDPRVRLQAGLLVVFAGALFAFLHVVEDFLDHESIVRWDVEFSRWLHVHSNATLRMVFEVVTWAGNVAFLALLVAVATLWLVRRRRFNEAALLAASALGIEILNGGLKLLFHRPRPEVAYVHLDTYSFPSGPATGSTAIYAVLFYVLAARSGRRVQVAAAAALVLLVAIIGFSRLYLEVHYLSDVVAGCSLGAAWASASLFVYELRRDGSVLDRLPRPVARVAEKVSDTGGVRHRSGS